MSYLANLKYIGVLTVSCDTFVEFLYRTWSGIYK